MDELIAELRTFLERLGARPESVSHRMEHYIEHLLRILPPEQEEIVHRRFGLFGHNAEATDAIAKSLGCSEEQIETDINVSLRRIAVSPEWQMIRQFASEEKN